MWKEYLEKFYDGTEVTGQELEQVVEVDEELNYPIIREEFDKGP